MNTNNIDKLRKEAAAAAGMASALMESFDPGYDGEIAQNLHAALHEMIRCGAKMTAAGIVEQIQAEDQKFIKKLEELHSIYAGTDPEYSEAINDILKIFKEM